MAKESKAKKKAKKNGGKKTGPEAVAMKAKAPRAENPFESIWSRRKFDILGKKRKGEERRVGLARSRAVEKRKKTLLKEYEQSLKASVFVDKRIGEHNDELGEFDKGIIRLQRERQLKLGKKSKYNLSDGEEEDYEGPVLGALSDRDDFAAGMLSDEDLKDDDLEAVGSKRKSKILKHINENRGREGFEGEEERHKSKKEIMGEIIMQSKIGRMEKAKQKEENGKLMEDLDKNFMSLVESRVIASLTEPEKMNALKALVKGTPKEHVRKEAAPLSQKKEQFDSYDKLIHEMGMDVRARPSDRTKTLEEIVQEERERLEVLEEDRKKRMHATDDLSDEDDENGDGESTKRPRAISGDDLGDSFAVDEEAKPRKGWIDEILEGGDDDNSDSEEDDDGSSDDLGSEGGGGDSDDDDEDEDEDEQGKALLRKDWEQSDDDELGTELDDDDDADEPPDSDGADEDEETQPRVLKKSKKDDVGQRGKVEGSSGKEREKSSKKEQISTQNNIPFLIDAPKNFQELIALVDNRSDADVLVIINRIRATNAIKLAAENRKKMQVFYGVLLQYFATLANKKPLNFELLNMLVKPLIEMSMEIPYFAAICARERLLRTRSQFCEAIKNPENGCWPSSKTLFLLRLWSMIFPCSDFRHAVMTPSILLMSEYLMRCPITSGRDIAIGSFLCSMVLLVAKQSQKFCPEAILFLRTLLTAVSDDKKSSPAPESEFYHFMELNSLSSLLRIQDHAKEINPLNFLEVIDMPSDSPFFSSDNFRASVLSCLVETLKGFVEISGGLNSFPEIFLPISGLLHGVGMQGKLPEELKKKFEDLARLIREKAEEHHVQRKPLLMRKHKPVPIKMVNPKFEENFVKGRDYDPDRERAEVRKLKKLIKQEAKGAIRELRKDSYFMSEVKARERGEKEQERADKYGKALAFLQEQEHAFKSGQLGKGKGKGKKRRR